MVGLEPRGRQLIPMLATLLLRSGSPSSDLHGLDRIDTHQCVCNIRVHAVKHRLTETGRHTRGNHRNPGTNGVALTPDFPHELLQLLDARRIRAEKRILVSERRVDRIELQAADLTEITADTYSQPIPEVLARDGTRGDPHDSFPRRRPATATIITESVLVLVRVVRVTRAKSVFDLLVVSRACIGVLDENTDGGHGRTTLKHTRKDPYHIALAALTHEMGCAGPPSIDIGLEVRLRQFHARRTAIDVATHGRAVALTERRYGE